MSNLLIDYIKKGDIAKVKELLNQGVDPNFLHEEGFTPLIYAIEYEHMAIVRELLSSPRINPNLEDYYGGTPLSYAADMKGPLAEEIIKLLLEKGADTTKTYNGRTVREKLLKSNRIRIAKLFPEPGWIERRRFPKRKYDWLQRRGKNLGYKVNEEGVSTGVAAMAMQALLFDEHDKDGNLIELQIFKNRLSWIGLINEEKFSYCIAAAENKRLIFLQEITLSVNAMTETEIDAQLATFDSSALNYQLQQKKKLLIAMQVNNRLTDNERMAVQVRPFYEGIQLYQSGLKHLEYFNKKEIPYYQEIEPVMRIIQPDKLKQKGGVVSIDNISGIYSHKEMVQYFHGLREVLGTPPALTVPVPLILSNINHRMTVGYDSLKKEWIMIEPSELKGESIFRTKDEREIAKWVSLAFSCINITAFNTQIYAAADNSSAMKAKVEQWKHQPQWKKMHAITDKKTKMVDDTGRHWAELAARAGQKDILKELGSKKNFFGRHWFSIMVGIGCVAIVIGLGVLTAGGFPAALGIAIGLYMGLVGGLVGWTAKLYVERLSQVKKIARMKQLPMTVATVDKNTQHILTTLEKNSSVARKDDEVNIENVDKHSGRLTQTEGEEFPHVTNSRITTKP